MLIGLSWTEAFLVGALLSPTDPVLSSSVVNNPRVPRVIRHSLNLESGLNDGLALPAVLAFTAALAADNDFVWWKFLLQDVSLGVAYGLLIGYLASRILPRGRDLERSMAAHQRALYALGVAFLTYGLTTLPPHGNGVIAVFVCAIVLGIRRPDIPKYFELSSDIIEIVKLGVFVVFGSLLTLHGLFTDGWAAVGVVARDAPGRAHGGGLDRAGGHRRRLCREGVHGLVRAQGRGHDDLLAARPQRGDPAGRADLQPGRAGRDVLGHRARTDRHAGL